MSSTSPRQAAQLQVFSAAEIAQAARVPLSQIQTLLERGDVVSFHSYVRGADAVRLVRSLRADAAPADPRHPGVTLLPDVTRRRNLSLVASGALHVAFLVIMVLIASLGWLTSVDTEQEIKEPQPVRLVFFMTPGRSGGGGGGGLKVDLPASRPERKAPPKAVKKDDTPIPPVRKDPPPQPVEPPKPIDPPKPVEPPKIDPPKIDPPKVVPPKSPPAPAIQAPVAPSATGQVNKPGDPARPPAASASAGPGNGGGAGSGTGGGLGDGRGNGLGAGSGGGTGGGPFLPGSGIDPPTLLHEVKPLYTDDARRRSVEGNVTLEIVVRRDGTVSDLRVLRSLGSGLDERAIEAVRQWRFSPARRQGSPVDVIAQVSVEFRLR
jgi:TonB family protein